MKLFLLMGVGLLSGTAALAQTDNKYLDDAYYRRSDLKKIDKEERRKAELRRAPRRPSVSLGKGTGCTHRQLQEEAGRS